MKTYILTADVGTGGVTDGTFVKQDGAGGVIDNDTAGLEIGVANTTKAAGYKTGVIKDGLMKIVAEAAAYNFGDQLEVAAGGITLQGVTTGTVVASAAETLDLSLGAGELLVYLDMQ
jgi:hypothetical protein